MERRSSFLCYNTFFCILILVCASYDVSADSIGELNAVDTGAGFVKGDSYTKLRFVLNIDVPEENITKIRVDIPNGLRVVSDMEISTAGFSQRKYSDNQFILVSDQEKKYIIFNILPDSITQKSTVKFGFYVACLRVDIDTQVKFKVTLISSNNKEFMVYNGNTDGKANNDSLNLTISRSEKPVDTTPSTIQSKNSFFRDLRIKYLALPKIIQILFIIFIVPCLACLIGSLRGLKPIHRSKNDEPIIYKSYSLIPPMRSITKKKVSEVTLLSFRQEWSLLLNTLSPHVIWVVDATSQTYVMQYAHNGDLTHALDWVQPPPRPIVPNILRTQNTSKGEPPKLITKNKFRRGTDDDLIVCLTMVLQVAEGFRELRDQAGLIAYFDVKPGNILIWKYKYRRNIPEINVHIKVTDLGTAAGPIVDGGGGTTFFRCKKCQYGTGHQVSQKCDVFALGRLMWYLIMYMRSDKNYANYIALGTRSSLSLVKELEDTLGYGYKDLSEVYKKSEGYCIDFDDFIGKLNDIKRDFINRSNVVLHEPVRPSLWQHLWHYPLKTVYGWPRKIISSILLILVFVCFIGFTPSVIEVNGTVKDAIAKTPISRAKLILDNEEVAITEEDGSYFTAIPLNRGKHELTAYHEKYKEDSMTLDITAKRSVANFTLPLKNIPIDIIELIKKEVGITPEKPEILDVIYAPPKPIPEMKAKNWYFASMDKVNVSYDNKSADPIQIDDYWIYEIPSEIKYVMLDGKQPLSKGDIGTVENLPKEEAIKVAKDCPVPTPR